MNEMMLEWQGWKPLHPCLVPVKWPRNDTFLIPASFRDGLDENEWDGVDNFPYRESLSVILNKKKSEVLTFLSRDSMTMWFSNDNAWMGASCSIESPRLQRRWFFHIFSTCKQLKTRPALCLWQFVFRMISVESAKLTQYFVKKICEGDMEGGKGGLSLILWLC